MRVLLIHHLEPEWENGYMDSGWTFHSLQHSLAVNLRKRKKQFDKIILTRFSGHSAPPETYVHLHPFIDVTYGYSYHWMIEHFLSDYDSIYNAQMLLYEDKGEFLTPTGHVFCKGNKHSEIVLIPEWLRELKDCQVTLCGAFDGECVDDMETALQHCDINYKRWETFIL